MIKGQPPAARRTPRTNRHGRRNRFVTSGVNTNAQQPGYVPTPDVVAMDGLAFVARRVLAGAPVCLP